MSYNILYTLPFDGLVKEKSNQEVGDTLFRLLYSLLTVNAYFDNDVTIYTDFNGMSILSILPFNFELIYYNQLADFNKRALKTQYSPFLLLNDKVYFKSHVDFSGNYIGFNDLIFVENVDMFKENIEVNIANLQKENNDTSLFENNLEVTEIRDIIKDISIIMYDNFMNKINGYIEYK